VAVQTRYARNGDVHLAYQVRGGGAVDVLMPSFGTISIAAFDAERHMARFMERLAGFARLVCYDPRGVGLSDPIAAASPPTLETCVDDALAVLDRVDCERAFVFAYNLAGPAAILLAAAHPDRVTGLVLCNSYARLERAYDYPFGIPRGVVEQFSHHVIDPDGGSDTADVMTTYAPSVATDAAFQRWWEEEGLRDASPATARALTKLQAFADVRDVLPTIRVPTLILHSRGALWCRIDHGRYLAEHIPHAKLVELPSADMPFFTDASDVVLGELAEFLTGRRRELEPDRVLMSILFTDIVASTEHAAAVGDRSWRELLDRHDELVRRQLARFGGREIKTTGDGFLATFNGPGRAVRCAAAIRDGARQLGFDIRAGVHTGEVELRGDDIGGIAVNLAQRVSSVAGSGEVLVSATVKDLVFGSGIHFAQRGGHELRGVPGTWQLYEVVST
jgi:class 3 adenylate cyclase/alpha-beta hydrolase superfamily lysophospholipase